nr:DUF2835 family protein [Salinicola sp. S1-1-2]
MPSVDIFLDLTPAQCRRYYHGEADAIDTHAVDGRRVRLPARALHRIVQRDGVHGRYRLHFDDRGSFLSIERLGT